MRTAYGRSSRSSVSSSIEAISVGRPRCRPLARNGAVGDARTNGIDLDQTPQVAAKSIIRRIARRAGRVGLCDQLEIVMSEEKSDKKDVRPSTSKVGISRRHLLGSTSAIAASVLASTALPRTANAATDPVLPQPEQPFHGKIERTLKGSVPDFPKGVEAPAGAPNVLLNPDRRRRLRGKQHVWRSDPDTQLPARRRRWPSLQHVSHDRAVLTNEGGIDHRAEPPLGRQRCHNRICHGLSRLQFAGVEQHRFGRSCA